MFSSSDELRTRNAGHRLRDHSWQRRAPSRHRWRVGTPGWWRTWAGSPGGV